MPPEIITLLKRKLDRLHDNHVYAIGIASSDSIKKIEFNRRSTISLSYECLITLVLKSLLDFQSKINFELINLIESTYTDFSEIDKIAVIEVVQSYFKHSTYLDIFDGFAHSITRHFGRSGINIDLSIFRLDMLRAQFHVGTCNGIRTFISSLTDNLEIIILRQKIKTALDDKKLDSISLQANQLIKIEPNIFGIGINFNYLIRRLLGKKE